MCPPLATSHTVRVNTALVCPSASPPLAFGSVRFFCLQLCENRVARLESLASLGTVLREAIWKFSLCLPLSFLTWGGKKKKKRQRGRELYKSDPIWITWREWREDSVTSSSRIVFAAVTLLSKRVSRQHCTQHVCPCLAGVLVRVRACMRTYQVSEHRVLGLVSHDYAVIVFCGFLAKHEACAFCVFTNGYKNRWWGKGKLFTNLHSLRENA